jgi:hypothetical protein
LSFENYILKSSDNYYLIPKKEDWLNGRLYFVFDSTRNR